MLLGLKPEQPEEPEPEVKVSKPTVASELSLIVYCWVQVSKPAIKFRKRKMVSARTRDSDEDWTLEMLLLLLLHSVVPSIIM